MKTIKRTVSLLLCILLLTSVSLCAFADTPPVYRKYNSVFSIGDSNTMGFGLPGYKGNYGSGIYTDPYKTYLKGVEGCYCDIVADALGIDDSFEARMNMAYPAVRAKDACWFLGAADESIMDGDVFFESYRNDYETHELTDNRDVHFLDRMKSSDLILVYAGASDVFYSSFRVLNIMENSGEVNESDLSEVAPALAELMWNGYKSFNIYVPMLIEYIREQNPTADIAVIGTFNPVKDLKIDADDLFSVFNAASVISDLMNSSTKAWAEQYGCIYVDISNVETLTIQNGYVMADLYRGDPEYIYHATPEGYRYIARQILKALETDKKSTTDIVVDLGSVKSVSSVLVDGFPITDYTYEGSILTVPSSVPIAKTLTVTEKTDSGTFLVTYRLSYNGTGYDAHRLYAAKDINYTFKGIFNTLMSFIKPIFDALFGFLK